jgi:hypothetical protein
MGISNDIEHEQLLNAYFLFPTFPHLSFHLSSIILLATATKIDF